ncbi:ATP-binding protein [Actinomadura algeriensis]|uniref:ATP-binding protein n=1 Tax=Actinomadura algeriensis TaxID=1679523 RepID=A0ABR9JSV3_9ACTN|nr:ATP-binding protein [Actinomadura algeriensis]MBE1533205.1 hypothetical protein [Actinomadura algeriensis]
MTTGGVRLGSGVDARRAQVLLDDLRNHLEDGERVVLVVRAERLRLSLSQLAVTNRRILGLAAGRLRRGGPVRQAELSRVVEADIRKVGFASPNTLIARLDDGSEVDFGDISPADQNDLVLSTLQEQRRALPPPPAPAATSPEPPTAGTPVAPGRPVAPQTLPHAVQPAPTRKPAGWGDDIPTSSKVKLPPDPEALQSLGRNHSLATALADLVDNSVDAGASQVVIRFVRRLGALRTLCVADNGRGITPDMIDTAMTIGGRREYGPRDLGHFGLGLKAASLSQARRLTVLSRAQGHAPVGRSWTPDDGRNGFLVDVVPEEFAERELASEPGPSSSGHGTIVRWDHVTGFPATSDPRRVEEFLSTAVSEVARHLGLVFHRLLEAGRIDIQIEVADVGDDAPAARFEVNSLNPFGYRRSGSRRYPMDLKVDVDRFHLTFRCHIWPGGSNMPEFRLSDSPANHQGLYIYRRDRLIQAGGEWGGITTVDKKLQLARVEVDFDDEAAHLLRMNPEKSRAVFGPEFTHLAEAARADDGTSFVAYLEDVRLATRRAGRRNTERRQEMIPPGEGLPDSVREIVEDETDPREQSDSVRILWKTFAADDSRLFEVDRDQETLWLNDRYHAADGNEQVLKTALYLLTEELFQGERIGPRARERMALWQAALTAAAGCKVAREPAAKREAHTPENAQRTAHTDAALGNTLGTGGECSPTVGGTTG